MLTYPSDSLPHIVCPMEEDAIPPNPFCNAPTHSEPPPPLLPLPSVTPSCEDDGKSGQRHSGHVQAVKDQPSTKPSHDESGATQRPSGRIPSPAEREGKSTTVRVPLSPSVKLVRVDTHRRQRAKQNKNALDFEDASECLTKHNDQGSTAGEGCLSAAESVDKQFAGNTALDLDACQSDTPRSDMDKFGELAVENQSASTGWVIGPLIQSFKSKMASFTQIVMSPVKLFKANSPPQSSDREDELNQCDQNDVRATFDVQGQGDNGNQDDETVSEEESISVSAFSLRQRGLDDQPSLSSAQNGLPDARRGINLETAFPEHPQTSLFDADLLEHTSVQAGECGLNEKAANANDSLPLRRNPSRHKTFEDDSQSSKSFLRSSSLSFQPADDAGASRGSKLKVSGDVEVRKGKTSARPKPRPRKPAGSRSVLQRGSSKTHAFEVNEEGPVHGLNGEQFYHLHTMETNISDSGDNGNALPTSVCYVPPDTFCPPHDDDALDGNKKDVSVRQSLRNNSKGAAGNERALKVVLDALPVQKPPDEPDITSDSVADSAVKVGKAKRRLKLSSQMDIEADLVKSKRLRADKCTEDTKHKGVLTTASDNGMLGGLKQPRNNVVSKNTLADVEVMLNPAAAEPPVSKGLKQKGKVGQKSLDTLNETALNTKTGNPSGAVTVSSLDCGNGVSENSQKAANRRKDNSSIKGLKKTSKFTLTNPDKNVVDKMDLETTMTTTAVTTTLITGDQEKLSEVFAQPLDAKLCRPQMADGKTVKYVRRKREVLPVLKVETSQSKSTELTRKPIKRKSRKQAGLTSEQGSALVPTSSATLTLEFTPADLDASRLLRGEESSKTGARQPCKRPKKDCSRSVKSLVSGGSQAEEIVDCCVAVDESQSQRKEATISAESLSVLSKMTPAEDNLKPSPSQPYPELSVRLNKGVVGTPRGCGKDETFPAEAAEQSQNTAMDEVETGHKEEESCTYKVSQLRQSARRVKTKPRRAENQRSMSRVLRSRTHQDEEKEEEEKQMNAVTSEETDLARAGTRSLENTGFSKRLLRSHSCPDIPSFLPHELPPTSPLYSPQHGRSHASPHGPLAHTPSVPHAHKWSRRARRHTVCSVEVEREIAPLCLRKEVYPSRRTASCGGLASHLSPGVPLSPSMSLSVLASCFLSSPLAFLSKKPENRGAAASGVGTCSHVFSPSSSSSSSGSTSSTSPSSSSVWRLFPSFRQRIESSTAAASSACSALSQIPLECDIETRQQSEEEEEEDGEDTSCSSQEFEDGGLREEKALSDSEIKVVKKHEERGKVSSIRIRKTLPKPQNNLTPMGLPRPIRLKKKEFSLEEIYTNKNFTKPPESRLETIFELPLSRRNGSECLFGQKRVKRVVEFPELGVARKPKKPLVGAGKAGNTSSLGRPRRGGYHNATDEPAVSVQELDSLLCAKLDQLDLWLTFDQKDS